MELQKKQSLGPGGKGVRSRRVGCQGGYELRIIYCKMPKIKKSGAGSGQQGSGSSGGVSVDMK